MPAETTKLRATEEGPKARPKLLAADGQPEVNLGLIPGFGGCVRLLARVGPARARELIFTGWHVRADEAERIGLVARMFDSREAMLRGAEESLALSASRSPAAIALRKEILTSLEERTMRERLEIENVGFRRAFESDEMREGTAAFLEKRRPAFAPPGCPGVNAAIARHCRGSAGQEVSQRHEHDPVDRQGARARDRNERPGPRR